MHKDTIVVALAEAGKRGELREYGKIANTPAALRDSGGEAGRVMAGAFDFGYEAGSLRLRHSSAELSRPGTNASWSPRR